MTPSRKSKRGKTPRVKFRWVKVALLIFALVVMIGLGAGIGFVMGALETMPDIEEFRPRPALTSFVYDKDEALVTELHGPENRVLVSVDQIPPHVIEAFLAIEDARFYQHMGLDLWRIMGALYNNLTGGPIQGASTITQQLARTAWLHLEQHLERKIQEAFLAIQLERTFTKQEILEMYLNQINLGHGAYGIQAAAQVYFDKDVEDLTLVEGAMLAAIPKGPSLYSAHNNPELTRERRNLVLYEMAARDMISEEEAREAQAQPLGVVPLKPYADYEAAYFVDYVIHEIILEFTEKYEAEGMTRADARRAASDHLYQGGLRIYTTLDREVQREAEEAIHKHLEEPFPMYADRDFVQAAGVFLDPHTGHISAMVGGRSRTGRMEFNRAWQAHRQPGSAFKPIAAYTAALEMGHSPATVVDDFPKEYVQWDGDIWAPTNYDHTYHGLTTYREAMRRSVNVPAVKVLEEIGIEQGIEYAQRLGIQSLITEGPENDRGYALALGGLTKGVSPLEMATAYAPFANSGLRIEPVAVLRVEDDRGNLLFSSQTRRDVAISRETAYLMTDMLMSVVQDNRGAYNVDAGTGWRAAMPGWQVAGKTGTTDKYVDAWWVGYTPKHMGVVWLGFDQEHSMQDHYGAVFGGHYPALIWRDVMTVYHEGLEPVKFQVPRDIVEARIDIKSGLLPSAYTPSNMIRTEVFKRGNDPVEESDVWIRLTVSEEHSGYLYDPYCNKCTPIERVFLERPGFEPWRNPNTGREHRPTDHVLMPPTRLCTELHPEAISDTPPDANGDDPGDDDEDLDPGDDDPGDDDDDPEPGEPVSATREVRNNSFHPSAAITAKPGAEITLTVKAVDQDVLFRLPYLGIEEFIPEGEETTVVMSFSSGGTYDFHCGLSYPEEQRMFGRVLID